MHANDIIAVAEGGVIIVARRIWFLNFLGMALVPARLEKVCDAMGYTDPKDPERRLILERFRGRFSKSEEQCSDFYSPESQRKHLPGLDRKIEGWVRANLSFFGPEELAGILEYDKYRNKRISKDKI